MPNTKSRTVAIRRGLSFQKLDWTVVIGIGAMHLGLIAAPFYFTWTGLVILLVLGWLTGGVGITACYHRLLTHRSFRSPKWFEYLMTICGALAWQGSAVQWVGTHRIHHQHSDDQDDPHSPKEGFAWSHMFWCLHKSPDGRCAADAAKDLLRDIFHRVLHRFGWLFQIALAAAFFLIGEWYGGVGLSWVLWGICVRTVVVYHITWFVNSAAHTWGYRNYDTKDQSRNLWWVALLSWGEGWHNNHHAFPRSAAHGLRRFEFDVTYWTIRLFGLVGLAKDIVLPEPQDRPT